MTLCYPRCDLDQRLYLNPNKLLLYSVTRRAKGHGTPHGSSQVTSLEEVEELVLLGGQNRTVGNNNVNEHSSRSHLVLQVHITSTHGATGHVQDGRLNLIDLAGSERIKVMTGHRSLLEGDNTFRVDGSDPGRCPSP